MSLLLAFALPGFPDADPVGGIVGGMMIGGAAALMLLGMGRIAGVSGIAARLMGLSAGDLPRLSALAFIIGLPLGAALAYQMAGRGMGEFPSAASLIIAGLLVGYGTRMGSGCTSGHGVCGMSRLSPRSIAATVTFMAAGIATVIIMNMIGS